MITENLNKNKFLKLLLAARDKYLYKKVNKTENKHFYIANIYRGKIRPGMD